MSDKATPPPVPNLGAALPRRNTYFGRRSAHVIAHLQSRNADEALREMDLLAVAIDDRMEEWDDDGRWEAVFFKEAEEGLAAMERARPLILSGDFNGALAEIEAASFVRNPAHVEAAYKLAMEPQHVI